MSDSPALRRHISSLIPPWARSVIRRAPLVSPAWRRAWAKSRDFVGDPNYDLAAVDRSFADRRGAPIDDHAILERVSASYDKAKLAQKAKGSSFHPSNEWLPIYEAELAAVMRALSTGDLEALGRLYRNFFRESCSAGLVGVTDDMKRDFFNGRISGLSRRLFLNDSIHRYRLWKGLLGNAHKVSELEAPAIGNPFGVFVDGAFVYCGFYQHYYAAQISRLVKRRPRPIVVELGGGYGGMAYFLIRDNPNVAYVDFDLPENMALTAYYLLRAFPQRRVLLYGEGELNAEALKEHSIVVMPSFEMSKLDDLSVDCAFNSYSLAEMSPETIKTFVGEFSRVVRGHILHVNHNRKSVVRADDFGIDPELFDLVYKTPALWNLGRDAGMDEYEYLYARVEGR